VLCERQVKLTPLVLPPEPLHSLVSGNGPDSKYFLNHIQQYNNFFQMTSFEATKAIRENFMLTFKVSILKNNKLLPPLA